MPVYVEMVKDKKTGKMVEKKLDLKRKNNITLELMSLMCLEIENK